MHTITATRRAARTAARAQRPPVTVEVTDDATGQVTTRRSKLRRPGRQVATAAAITASRYGLLV